MDYIIEVKHLTRDYGFGRGVFDVSFSIKKGETFGFLGPNGAGKTTTIRHLMGFSEAKIGETTILGLNTFNQYSTILKHVGYIPGELAFPAGLTGYELIRMMQDLIGKRDTTRLDELLSIFKLEHRLLKMSTKRMSLGVKRKLAIVTAFMSDPEILILDEPTSGLDPFMQNVFIEFIKKEKEKGKTILLSSHIFNEIDQTCDRVSIIKEGRIIDTFITNDLKHDKQKFYQLRFRDLDNYKKFIEGQMDNDMIHIIDHKVDTYEVLIRTYDDYIDQVIEILTNYKVDEFRHKKESLEEYFLKFYKDGKEFGGLR